MYFIYKIHFKRYFIYKMYFNDFSYTEEDIIQLDKFKDFCLNQPNIQFIKTDFIVNKINNNGFNIFLIINPVV